MKAKITIAGALLSSLLLGKLSYAQNDMAIGNISAGWNTYNSSTGVITGVYFDVLNNENSNPGSFDVKVYLVDPNDYNITYTVWSYTDGDGQGGNTVVTYDNIDIDFNNTSGIPGGQYRLAVCVDPDNAISETDENNNCLFISPQGNNLTFNPSTASIDPSGSGHNGVTLYPNPARTLVTFKVDNNWGKTSIQLSDISGKIVKSTELSLSTTDLDISDLTQGLYIYRIVGMDGKIWSTGKLIKE